MKLAFFSALHHGYNVHHMGIILHFHELGNLYRSEFCDASHIVSCQIHQHDMLGALLFILKQVILQKRIFLRIHTASACSCNGTGENAFSLLFYDHLRRTSDHLKVTIVEIVQIWGWI